MSAWSWIALAAVITFVAIGVLVAREQTTHKVTSVPASPGDSTATSTSRSTNR
jgi:hypothetical protein